MKSTLGAPRGAWAPWGAFAYSCWAVGLGSFIAGVVLDLMK